MFDIIALGELNVDLILNQIEGFPEVGKEKFAHQMTLTLGTVLRLSLPPMLPHSG